MNQRENFMETNMHSLKIAANYENLNTKELRERAQKVFLEIATVVNSREFAICFIEEMKTIHGERSKWKYASPMEIYTHFMSGAETLSPEKDGEMDIELDDYHTVKRVLGYTQKNIKTVFVNSRLFIKLSIKKAGSFICHEWAHKLGFEHDFWKTSERPFSVCYRINSAYERAHELIYGPEILPKRLVCSRSWRTLWITKKCREANS